MTQPEGHFLAQFNWATLRHDVGDPRIAEFVDNVARMNALAERFPGFVWRHLNDRAALKRLRAPGWGGPRFTTTLSVWRDAQALKTFSFRTVHKRFLAKREEWFERNTAPNIVMWWVPEGELPDIAQAVARAERLLAEGPGPEGFGWDWLAQAERAA